MRPLILITNDDGIHSPGLKAACEAVFDLADLVICAPEKQQTGMGRSFPRSPDQGILNKYIFKFGNSPADAYGIHGSPAYAAAHGILELAGRKPDLCISGINYGENLGMTLTCSGTMGAAFEAQSHGVPAIAVSLEIDLEHQRKSDYISADWAVSKAVTREWAAKILQEGLPSHVDIYNINVPAKIRDITHQKITRMSKQNYYEFIVPERKNYSKPYELKAEVKVDFDNLPANSDIYAVCVDKAISVTPLGWDLSVDL